jgi:hypothetical protein
MSNGTDTLAAPAPFVIPFPPTPPQWGGLNFTPKSAFLSATGATPVAYTDPVTGVEHTATITSNTGGVLSVNTEGTTLTFSLTGDGSACIPLTLLVSP